MNYEATKILIIDDHPAMGFGTKNILEQMNTVKVVGIAENGKKGIEMVEELTPEIILLDMNLPDMSGKNVAKHIKEKYPHIHIIIFTGYSYVPYFNDLIKIGLSGVLMKSAAPRQLHRMVESILDGETVIPLTLFKHIQISDLDDESIEKRIKLSNREKEVLTLITEGKTNKEIAEDINLSLRSVEYCLTSIYEKLEVKSRAEAIMKYLTLIKEFNYNN